MRLTIRTAPSAALLLGLLLAGCTPVLHVGLKPFYRPAELAAGAVRADVPYLPGASAPDEKQRLDLYVPATLTGPTLVFVHGGSLLRGDKDQRVGGYDIYGNIGRFYASRGVTVAVVDYRLQPHVSWRAQVDDVAAAVAWVIADGEASGRGGRVFLMGHSAGAWLVARVAVDVAVQTRWHIGRGQIAGVISVSGSGFDMRDRRTWQMYDREEWWAERFRVAEPGLDWREEASIVPLVSRDAPPFLQLHAARELRALARQNLLLHRALARSGVPSELVEVENGSHRRTVLAMSRPDREVAQRILRFIARPTGVGGGE